MRGKVKHNELCMIASRWLKRHTNNMQVPNCPVIATDMVTAESETPDVIGWCSGRSVMIEVKVNRADFLKDKKKLFRIYEDFGVGDNRLYCCPNGLIKPNEIPDNWGLLYYNEDELKPKIELIVKPSYIKPNLNAERNMMYSIIRRLKDK